MWGEDYIFCKNAIEAGINIWCDPNIEFIHAGVTGKLTEVLKFKNDVRHENFVYKT